MTNSAHIKFLKRVLLFALVGVTSLTCTIRQEQTDPVEPLPVLVTDPVNRDLAEIKQSGVIRMITNYSSNSYFLHKGIEMGFEYELVKEFANQNDLALEVIIIEANENPYDILNSGEGDVIAANYSITDERKEYVSFTRPYNLVDQVLVYNESFFQEEGVDVNLENIPITINRNSSYYEAVFDYSEPGIELAVELTSDDVDTEALLYRVANGTYLATVADENIFDASASYMGNLVKGPTISENDTIAWAVRKNSPDLNTAMNRFLYRHFRFGSEPGQVKRSAFLNIIKKRYFEEGIQLDGFYEDVNIVEGAGGISIYDDLVKEKSEKYDLDWVMITAMIAQESKFKPDSESWAGAVGLMQVLPRFSEYTKDSLFIPDVNIDEGARILREHLNHYAYMDSTNQWAFSLATYNAGLGHLADARRLVVDQNKDPNQWENVSKALLQLMQRRHYEDARYGFTRGIETVRYVNEILNRYKTYNTILSVSEDGNMQFRGVMGIKTGTY